MEYIPPKNRDTRYALWYDRYECRVPYIQTKTLQELEEEGLPTSGDPHHDHAMQWEPRLYSLPIHRMAELWHNGANISIVRQSDAPKIFDAISKHLHAWKNHILTSYNPSTPPYDDLLILDQFANIVYEHARFAYDDNFINKHFKISSSTAIGRRAMLSAMAKADEARMNRKDSDAPIVKNITYYDSVPKYNPDAVHNFVDYSGKNTEYNAPIRNSLASHFKKGAK